MRATNEGAPAPEGRSRFANEAERRDYLAFLNDEVSRVAWEYGEAGAYEQPAGHLVVGIEAAALELEERYVALRDRLAAEAEAAYRRGYSQGYFAAATDAAGMHKRGFGRAREVANVLLDHARNVVLPWRYRAAEGRQDAPALERLDWFLLRHQTFARDGRQCVECGSERHLEIDHIKGVNEGGLPLLENLRVLCRTCNRSRPRGPRGEA